MSTFNQKLLLLHYFLDCVGQILTTRGQVLRALPLVMAWDLTVLNMRLSSFPRVQRNSYNYRDVFFSLFPQALGNLL